jgi:DNA-directed RNA polymerase subunit H
MSAEKKIIKITNHVYQPKHEILTRDEAERILNKYNTKGLQDLDVRPGDVIKITRKSPTAGESVYYRYVVEG